MSEVVDDRHRPISRRRTRRLATRHRVVQPDPPYPATTDRTASSFSTKTCPCGLPFRLLDAVEVRNDDVCRCLGNRRSGSSAFRRLPRATRSARRRRMAGPPTQQRSPHPGRLPRPHFDKAAAEAAIKKAVHAAGDTRPEVTVTVVNAIPPAPPADVPWLSHPLVHPATSDGNTSGRCAGLERPSRRSEIRSLWAASDGRQPSVAAVQRSIASCRSWSTRWIRSLRLMWSR
jgi:hypothetical protein